MSDGNEQKPNNSQEENKGKVTNNERNLTVSFIQFLRQKVSANQCTDDQIEALEVATQCLESAFNLSDMNYAFQPSKQLIDIFKAAEGLPDGDEIFPTPTEAEVEEANRLKEEGNELVKQGKLQEAIQKYNEAIKLNRFPIYFCNRAAAYCRMEQYDLAIQDCRTALALDPNYAKAYGRMGVALSCQNRYDHAVEAYKKALELDPNNDSYKNNLSIAEEKLKQAQEAFANSSQGQNPQGIGNFLGGLGTFFNNPDVLRMTSQMMQDPNIQNMMGQMMQTMAGGMGPAGPQNVENLVRMGEQLSHQMQQQNPDLVEQLRRAFGGPEGENPPEGGEGNGGNPGPDNNQGKEGGN